MPIRVYTDTMLNEMVRMAAEGMESREAYESLMKRRLLPEGLSLSSFRAKCSEKRIVWGGKLTNVSYLLTHEYIDRLFLNAEARKTTLGNLTRQLMIKIIDDDLFDAVLDDKP